MTHDDVLTLLAFTGRSDEAIRTIVDSFSDAQHAAMRGDGILGSTWRLTHVLNHPTRATRAKGELALARIMSMEE